MRARPRSVLERTGCRVMENAPLCKRNLFLDEDEAINDSVAAIVHSCRSSRVGPGSPAAVSLKQLFPATPHLSAWRPWREF